MSDAIGRLGAEHRVIERVLLALELAAGQEVASAFYRQALRFLTQYADRCHHGKEEDLLFPVLEARGLPCEGPTSVMREEHDVGRGHLRSLAQALEAQDLAGLRDTSLAYVALMRDHIYKEDELLFPMAQSVLRPDDDEALQAGFDRCDQALPERAELVTLAADLLARVGGPG